MYSKVVYSNISDADKKRLLSKLKGDSYDEILKAAKSLGLNDIVSLLESPGYKSRFNQYESIKNDIDAEIKKMRNNELNISSEGYKKIAYDGYYKSIYEMQKQTGLGFSFNQFDEKLYNKIINSKWSGSNYSTRIWNNTNKLAQDLKSEILQGLIAGKTQKEMSKTILKKYQQSAYNTRRLIRTESCFVSNEIERQAYLECDIEKCRFVATLDLRTSKECQERDGNIIEVKKATVGIDLPPLHPFCRSTTISVIDNETLQRMERRARNPVTGKLEKVPANMTYKEWKKRYVDNQPQSDIIRNISIDDIKDAAGDKDISLEVLEVISKASEGKGFYYNEVVIKKISPDKDGTIPLLQTEPYFGGRTAMTRLIINEDVFVGKTLEEINERIANSKGTVANSLIDAVNHENGHAKLIYGKSISQIEELYKKLDNVHYEGISNVAKKDGTELIAEVEVLIQRNEKVPKAAKGIYDKYIGEISNVAKKDGIDLTAEVEIPHTKK